MLELDEIGKQIVKNNFSAAFNAVKWQVKRTWRVAPTVSGRAVDTKKIKDIQLSKCCKYKIAENIISLQNDGWYSKESLQKRMLLDQYLLQENLGANNILWPMSVVESGTEKVLGGVKVRLQLPEELLLELYKSKFEQLKIDYIGFRNQVYMKILQQFANYRWLLTYLTGATPFGEGANASPVRSQSECCSIPVLKAADQVDYRSLQSYLQNSQYRQTRKTDGVTVASSFENEVEMLQKGIHYLEIPHLDLDPFAITGIRPEILDLLEALAAFFIATPGIRNEEMAATLQKNRQLNQQIAHENPFSATECQLQAQKTLNKLQRFVQAVGLGELEQSLDKAIALSKAPTETPSAKLLRGHAGRPMTTSAQQLAVRNGTSNESLLDHSELRILDDNSRLVLCAAFKLGVSYSVVSSQDKLIKVGNTMLECGIQTEDSSAVMQKVWSNRQLSKKIAAAAGYTVPTQWNVSQKSEIAKVYQEVKGAAIAIKNNRTSGTHVFRVPPTQKLFAQTVKQYLTLAAPCLVEQVVTGAPYTALLVGGKVVSLVERIPQNIVGNGRSTIKQLIQNKENERKKLGRCFDFGEIQKKSLAEQGRTLTDVLPRGVQLYLRYDASTKTGADYLEVRAETDVSYLQRLEELAGLLKMSSGSLDVLISNIYQPLASDAEKGQFVFLNAHAFPQLSKHQHTLLKETQAIAESIVKNAVSLK
ncbi:hypothetical protein JCM15457_997 [Liquorilactobacillus sucicola DSM 21376 = JCM 15457]|nr:hypothetical protein [Liquorilactobacillus sucicola]GAJ26086.1 hypothetical protein JCM15457_997 [Liquorilactobacillus sucicola DSM 21376 = JCM 15457]